MSLAIAIRDSRPIRSYGYEPISDDSQGLSRKWDREKNYLRGSASDWLPTIDAALRDIRVECHIADWDGTGANAITDQVIAITKEVVTALFALLPKGIPAPDVIPEGDGEICMSWSIDRDRLFSLSLGGHGKINFSGQFGKEGGIHGWQPIDATSPNALDESLQDVAKYLGKLYPPATNRRPV